MPLMERVSFRTTPNGFRKIPHIEGEYSELCLVRKLLRVSRSRKGARCSNEAEGGGAFHKRNGQWNVLVRRWYQREMDIARLMMELERRVQVE
jgi:hypothetical protein